MKLQRRLLRGRLATIALAFVLLGPTACGDDATGPGDGSPDVGSWRGTIATGGRIEIEGISGSMTATYTSGSETVVDWVKTGRAGDRSRVRVEVDVLAGGVRIRAIYPQGNLDVDVDFTLQVPAGVHFVATNVSGDVDAIDLRSDVTVAVVSGGVTISTTGVALANVVSGTVDISAATVAEAAVVSGTIDISGIEICQANVVSGTIDAVIGSANWGEDLGFSVTSGELTVQIPSNTNAEVVLTAASGTITSDFPLSGGPVTRRATLGSGGPTLTMTVSSGNLILRAGPPA